MIKPIQALLSILQGRIVLNDGTPVNVIKRDYPYDHTPCITIDNSGGSATIDKKITNRDYTIPETHPQYDPEHPDKTISQQVRREQIAIELGVHIWCDDEPQREEITKKVRTLFDMVQSDHYLFCQQYNNGNCTFLDTECKVNPHTIRGIKNQCPKPYDYHYKNIFTAFDIIRATFNVAPPYILDDTTTNPPVLRSIIRVYFSYYEYYNIGGAVSENLHVNEDLL